MTRPAQRRELAEKAVATKGISIVLACRAFGFSEACFRYSPKRDTENEFIANLLERPAKAHRTWVLDCVSCTCAMPRGTRGTISASMRPALHPGSAE